MRQTPSALQHGLNRPLALGGRTIPTRAILAPMAGLTHLAFREVLRGFGGCGLTWTEMCSARAVTSGHRNQAGYFRWTEGEQDSLVCQIMGSVPGDMARAAEVIEGQGFFGVDINMGCAVSRICSQGAGAALLREPDRAAAAVSAVRKAVSCPVLVKFRTGWTDDPGHAADMARRFEDAGADGLIFHPRVAPDRRSRPPKWDHIRHVVRAVSIPVFGNGNVVTAEDAASMLEGTGCAGVALGRIAAARPWIFAQLTRGYQPSPTGVARTAADLAVAIWHCYPPHIALRLFKTFTAYFCANFAFGHALRPKLCAGQNLQEIQASIAAHLNPCPQLLPRPNSLMFTS